MLCLGCWITAAKQGKTAPETFLEITFDRWPKSSTPNRMILVPDLNTIGGCEGFLKLVPRILGLHPNQVLLNAEDIYYARGRAELKEALKSIQSKSDCEAIFDRFSQCNLDLTEGIKGRVDPVKGIMRLGIIQVLDVPGGDEPNTTNSRSSNLRHINISWGMNIPNDSLWGCALEAAGYKTATEKGVRDYLMAMPVDFKRAELVVIDVTGTCSDDHESLPSNPR